MDNPGYMFIFGTGVASVQSSTPTLYIMDPPKMGSPPLPSFTGASSTSLSELFIGLLGLGSIRPTPPPFGAQKSRV